VFNTNLSSISIVPWREQILLW